eukprot:scaffold140554_cov151-Phaeocystis_antarctica.AAC.1
MSPTRGLRSAQTAAPRCSCSSPAACGARARWRCGPGTFGCRRSVRQPSSSTRRSACHSQAPGAPTSSSDS